MTTLRTIALIYGHAGDAMPLQEEAQPQVNNGLGVEVDINEPLFSQEELDDILNYRGVQKNTIPSSYPAPMNMIPEPPINTPAALMDQPSAGMNPIDQMMIHAPMNMQPDMYQLNPGDNDDTLEDLDSEDLDLLLQLADGDAFEFNMEPTDHLVNSFFTDPTDHSLRRAGQEDLLRYATPARHPPYNLLEQGQSHQDLPVGKNIQSSGLEDVPAGEYVKAKYNINTEEFKRKTVAEFHKRQKRKRINKNAFAKEMKINVNTLSGWIKKYTSEDLEIHTIPEAPTNAQAVSTDHLLRRAGQANLPTSLPARQYPFDLSEQDQAHQDPPVHENFQISRIEDVPTGEYGRAKRNIYTDEDRKEIVAEFHKRRKTKRISQIKFAGDMGMNFATLSKWIKKYPIKSNEVQIPTYRQDQNLDDKFYSTLAKEGRLLKPHQLDVSKEEEAAQEQAFLYEPLGDAGQESIKLVVHDYKLPGIEIGGPGIAPVATVEENGLAILTDKITGEYMHIPRTKDGGAWQNKQNNGYTLFIKGLRKKYPEIDVKDSVMAFVPNWIKPRQFYILYEDKATAIPTDKTEKNRLNYKCFQYTFEDEEYPVNGAKVKGFKDCSKSKRHSFRGLIKSEVKDLKENFPIQAATGSLRQEVAAAVSEDQAFFYFRHTSHPQLLKLIIQSPKDEPWEVAVQDVRRKLVMKLRNSKLTNVYVEKRNEDIEMFVTGIMPRSECPNAKPVKAYFKSCHVSNLETITKFKYCRYDSLDVPNEGTRQFETLEDKPFNFPLTYYLSVKDNDAPPSAKKQRIARR